jgi:hypothetical protein
LFEHIQFRFVLIGAVLMESAVLSFLKTVPPSNSWTPLIDLSQAYGENSPEVMRAHIDGILEDRLFVPMVFRGNTYRVIISQTSGSSASGFDESLVRQLSILEIPDSLGVPT